MSHGLCGVNEVFIFIEKNQQMLNNPQNKQTNKQTKWAPKTKGLTTKTNKSQSCTTFFS